jgi:AraC-like DNA-binding protein
MPAMPTCRNLRASLAAPSSSVEPWTKGSRPICSNSQPPRSPPPLVTADPELLKALEPFCDMEANERRTASDTLRAAVEKEVEKLLPHGKAQRRTVARALGMSTRTFARRLDVEGTTYEDVVDEFRRSLALQYLKDPGMSLSQIAWLLGYEGSTSFNHAFKRWTGYSPSAVRQGKPLPGHA